MQLELIQSGGAALSGYLVAPYILPVTGSVYRMFSGRVSAGVVVGGSVLASNFLLDTAIGKQVGAKVGEKFAPYVLDAIIAGAFGYYVDRSWGSAARYAGLAAASDFAFDEGVKRLGM